MRQRWDPVSGEALKPAYFHHVDEAPDKKYDFIEGFWKRTWLLGGPGTHTEAE